MGWVGAGKIARRGAKNMAVRDENGGSTTGEGVRWAVGSLRNWENICRGPNNPRAQLGIVTCHIVSNDWAVNVRGTGGGDGRRALGHCVIVKMLFLQTKMQWTPYGIYTIGCTTVVQPMVYIP